MSASIEKAQKVHSHQTPQSETQSSTEEYFLVTPSDPLWTEILSSTKIGEVIPQRTLVRAQYSEDVGTLLKRLSEGKVLAALIWDETKEECYGFVDVMDLLFYVLEVTSWSVDFCKENSINVKWEGQCFSWQTTGTLINYSQIDPFEKATLEAPLSEVVQLFAQGIHRLALMNEKDQVINVISQIDILDFLVKRGLCIGSKLTEPFYRIKFQSDCVGSVFDTTKTVDALRYMKENRYSGVPVLDKEGRIIANLSATDLVGLTAENFMWLALPVKEFLCRMHGFPKPPVFIHANDSVETLLLKFLVFHVHRIYVVDSKMKPTGVVTLTDVMKFFGNP